MLHPELPSDIRAFVFDWAGTVIDYGCFAPVGVFVASFAELGVEVSVEDARGPMGLPKWDHLAAMAALPHIDTQLRYRLGRPAQPSDIDQMYERFLPLQVERVRKYAELIPGATALVTALRERGIRIGSTTGYPAEVMDALVPLAAAAGYSPDCIVTASDMPQGRPKPWLLFEAMRRLDVYPSEKVVVIDDTPVGIVAARNAGAFAVGVVESSNGFGMTEREVAQLREASPEEYSQRYEAVAQALQAEGAQLVVATVADLVV